MRVSTHSVDGTDGHAAPVQIRTIIVLALSGAVMFAAKTAMAPLPNIEPVSLLILVYASVLGRRAFYPVFIFIGLDILLYGLNLWVINYLYVWPILVLAVLPLRKMRAPLGFAVLSGAFGLLFGALCAFVYLFVGGWAFALSWWVSGIPFDLLHGAANFVLALVLFAPCRRLYERLYSGAGGSPG